MKVFVTGGTGAVGTHAVKSLLEAGHDVTLLARNDQRAAKLSAKGIRNVRASLFDADRLKACLAGFDAVVNLASSLPASWQFLFPWAWTENTRIRTEGSRIVAEAALAAGVPRLIQESVSMLYRDNGADWIDEKSPVDQFPMAVGNHAAEASANGFTRKGGTGIVLRFGFFYGPGATHSEEFLAMAKWRLCTQIGPAGSYVSSIYMKDAGTAVVHALNAPAGTYNVVDDVPLTKHDYASALARAAGRKYFLRLPGRAALLLGNKTTSLTRSVRVSNERFKETTGWRPGFPSANEGWMDLAGNR